MGIEDIGIDSAEKSSGTKLPGNLLFLCSRHRLETFSVHFVDLPVLTDIKPFENSSSVSSLTNSNCSLVGGCGSLLLVDVDGIGRWSWA